MEDEVELASSGYPWPVILKGVISSMETYLENRYGNLWS